jgi:predicted O-linked N-acetylglucosamine transferase (SPINDLY family)
MSKTELGTEDTVSQCLTLAENLIDDNELNLALIILRNLEEISLHSIESDHQNRLVLTILEKYKKINELEKTAPLSKELAFLYLGFEKYYEASHIFENLLKTSDDDLLVVYGQLKCLTKLELDISCLKDYFDEFLIKTGLSPSQLEWACKTIGTFCLKSIKEDSLGIKFYEKAFELNPSCPELNLFFLRVHCNSINPDIEKYIAPAIKNTHLGSLPYFLAICTARKLGNEKLYKQLTEELVKNFPDDEWSYFHQSQKKHESGMTDECLAFLNLILEKNPHNLAAHDNRIMNSHYSPTISQEEILAIANEYHQNIIQPFVKTVGKNFEFSKYQDEYKEKKIIRVGFVSGDFKQHPVFFWVSSLLKYFPKEKFEIHCYVNNEENPFAESFHSLCHSFTYITQLTDTELAEKIFNDKIHVLIDLSGHTDLNRLRTFGLKPAPIEVTWLGQVGTTGVKEIDYMIADEFLIRKGEEHFYTEKICYLSSGGAYPAHDYQNLYINRSLARNDGKIIFGSFNNSNKINPTVMETWSEILKSVPESHLLISNYSLTTEPEYKIELIKSFKKLGIDESRLEFEMPETKASHLLRFSKIDIALDTFPFNGGTTTHETLMMSVPLIAIEGDRWASRMSADVLMSANLSELIAKDRQDYINKIVDLARSPEQIIYYKETIREKYLNSPATNMESFSKDFAAKIEDFWNQYLTSKKSDRITYR